MVGSAVIINNDNSTEPQEGTSEITWLCPLIV